MLIAPRQLLHQLYHHDRAGCAHGLLDRGDAARAGRRTDDVETIIGKLNEFRTWSGGDGNE